MNLNKKIIANAICLLFAPAAFAQSSACPPGMTLTYKTVARIPSCIGTALPRMPAADAGFGQNSAATQAPASVANPVAHQSISPGSQQQNSGIQSIPSQTSVQAYAPQSWGGGFSVGGGTSGEGSFAGQPATGLDANQLASGVRVFDPTGAYGQAVNPNASGFSVGGGNGTANNGGQVVAIPGATYLGGDIYIKDGVQYHLDGTPYSAGGGGGTFNAPTNVNNGNGVIAQLPDGTRVKINASAPYLPGQSNLGFSNVNGIAQAGEISQGNSVSSIPGPGLGAGGPAPFVGAPGGGSTTFTAPTNVNNGNGVIAQLPDGTRVRINASEPYLTNQSNLGFANVNGVAQVGEINQGNSVSSGSGVYSVKDGVSASYGVVQTNGAVPGGGGASFVPGPGLGAGGPAPFVVGPSVGTGGGSGGIVPGPGLGAGGPAPFVVGPSVGTGGGSGGIVPGPGLGAGGPAPFVVGPSVGTGGGSGGIPTTPFVPGPGLGAGGPAPFLDAPGGGSTTFTAPTNVNNGNGVIAQLPDGTRVKINASEPFLTNQPNLGFTNANGVAQAGVIDQQGGGATGVGPTR